MGGSAPARQRIKMESRAVQLIGKTLRQRDVDDHQALDKAEKAATTNRGDTGQKTCDRLIGKVNDAITEV